MTTQSDVLLVTTGWKSFFVLTRRMLFSVFLNGSLEAVFVADVVALLLWYRAE